MTTASINQKEFNSMIEQEIERIKAGKKVSEERFHFPAMVDGYYRDRTGKVYKYFIVTFRADGRDELLTSNPEMIENAIAKAVKYGREYQIYGMNKKRIA